MEQQAPVRLSDRDWEILLPNNTFKIGETTLNILPLGVDVISQSLGLLNELLSELEGTGITIDNMMENEDNTVATIQLVLRKIPQLISISAGLHVDDLRRLPIGTLIGLMVKFIDVNMQSREDFLKNFKALAGQLMGLQNLMTFRRRMEQKEATPEENGGTPTSANS